MLCLSSVKKSTDGLQSLVEERSDQPQAGQNLSAVCVPQGHEAAGTDRPTPYSHPYRDPAGRQNYHPVSNDSGVSGKGHRTSENRVRIHGSSYAEARRLQQRLWSATMKTSMRSRTYTTFSTKFSALRVETSG